MSWKRAFLYTLLTCRRSDWCQCLSTVLVYYLFSWCPDSRTLTRALSKCCVHIGARAWAPYRGTQSERGTSIKRINNCCEGWSIIFSQIFTFGPAKSTKQTCILHPCSMHPCIHVSMYPCIHASMYPCIHVSMYPCIFTIHNKKTTQLIYSCQKLLSRAGQNLSGNCNFVTRLG